RRFERSERHRQSVVNEETSNEGFPDLEQQLYGLSCLNQSNYAGQNAENTRFVAARGQLRRRRFRIQAAEARSFIRPKCGHLTIKPENASVKHRLFQHYGGVVDKVCRGKVVRAADDHVIVFENLEDV